MKYIRTSDGRIYETTGQDKKHPRYYNIANANLEIDALGIVMQADTIEELCDTIAIVWKDHLPTIWNDTTHFKDLLSMYSSYQRKHKIVAIYGSIWTDKGLIYVAKMNDKGELELL